MAAPLLQFFFREEGLEKIALDFDGTSQCQPRLLLLVRRGSELRNDLAVLGNQDWIVPLAHLVHQTKTFRFKFCSGDLHYDQSA